MLPKAASGIEGDSAELSGKFFCLYFSAIRMGSRSLALSTVAMWLPIGVPGVPPNS